MAMPFGGSISTETTNLLRLNLGPQTAFGFARRDAAYALLGLEDFDGSSRALPIARLAGLPFLDGFSHGSNVIGRGAAASADDARAKLGGLLGKKREIFGRRSRIDDAVADSLREAGVGHGRKRKRGARRIRAA